MLQVRTLVRRELNDALQQCDLLVGPSTSGPAFRLGSVVEDPLAMYKADMTTVALNLAGAELLLAGSPVCCCAWLILAVCAGLPAISVPCGFAEDKGAQLPLGLQIIGPAFEEAAILRCAHVFQQTADFALGTPPC